MSPDRGYRINRMLFVVHTGLASFTLVLVPVFLLPVSPHWGWSLLLPVLLTNAWWAFIHESLHGTMFQDKGANRLAGRVQSVLYGAAYDLLRWGHLLHHGHSRTRRERSEVYRPGEAGSLALGMAYYFRLLGGLYLFEVIGTWLYLLPRRVVRYVARRLDREANLVVLLDARLAEPGITRALRLDALLILALHGLALVLYGDYAWMLLLAYAGRALLISLVDNAFHYGAPLDDPRHGFNLSMPELLSRLWLRFNLHGAHHRRPGLPWWELPRSHRDSGQGYQKPWLAAIAAQIRGPIREDRLIPGD